MSWAFSQKKGYRSLGDAAYVLGLKGISSFGDDYAEMIFRETPMSPQAAGKDDLLLASRD